MSTANLKAALTAQPERPNIMALLGQEKTRKQLAALAGRYMDGERMLALLVNCVRKTPKLAECDPQSVLSCMMVLAGLGLEPNTPTGQAYLIPYERRVKRGRDWATVVDCQVQIGYKGFITLALRSPRVLSIEAEAIREGDQFEHLQGSRAHLEYRKALRGRGELLGAFCLVKLEGGAEVAVTLPVDEIYKAREKSETYRALVAKVANAETEKDRAIAEKKLSDTPWVLWEDAMAAKTAIKALISKRLSLSSGDQVSVAAQADERTVTSVEAAEQLLAGNDAPALPDPSEFEEYEITRTPVDSKEPSPVRRKEPEQAAHTSAVPSSTAEPPASGPTLGDVVALLKKGDLDGAADIAQSLTGADAEAAQDAIREAMAK